MKNTIVGLIGAFGLLLSVAAFSPQDSGSQTVNGTINDTVVAAVCLEIKEEIVYKTIYDTVQVFKEVEVPVEVPWINQQPIDTFYTYLGERVDVQLKPAFTVGETNYSMEEWLQIIEETPVAGVVSDALVGLWTTETLGGAETLGYWRNEYDHQVGAYAVDQVPYLEIADSELEWRFGDDRAFIFQTDELNFQGDFTIMVKLGSDIGTSGTILSKGDGFELTRINDGIQLNGVDIFGTILPDQVIAITYDSVSSQVSVDSEGVTVTTPLDVSTNTKFILGKRFDGSSQFDGTVKKVLFASKTYSDQNIQILMDALND